LNVHTFYIYQISWYVFGTAVAFIAALFFWKKGRSEVRGRTIELGLGLKLTGAGAIFVAVLLVFHIINPLKPLCDYKKIFLVLTDEKISVPTGNKVEYKLKASRISNDIQFDPDKLAIELIPWNYIYDMCPAFDDKSYVTREAIPQGKYKIRFIYKDTGKSKEFTITIPRSQ